MNTVKFYRGNKIVRVRCCRDHGVQGRQQPTVPEANRKMIAAGYSRKRPAKKAVQP